MRLRGYIEGIDFPLVQKWTGEERVHALWCAGRFAYPLDRDDFREMLKKSGAQWQDCPYMVTEDDGRPIGFFTYNVNAEENYGFLKFIVLDGSLRGQGYGTRMLQLISRFAFEITGVSELRISVFDVNKAAVGCYRKAGFCEAGREENAFTFQGESWGRIHMKKEQPGKER
ncbi:MAG: GNAT family N-acetyltransferase [Butyrivibrio sp.]|nr:GNAT family N-acetyltransferase [Acetatifactor muris]MCM1560356.1 GNAT family N-acetyltransferase [Butyrivibrio sp.]